MEKNKFYKVTVKIIKTGDPLFHGVKYLAMHCPACLPYTSKGGSPNGSGEKKNRKLENFSSNSKKKKKTLPNMCIFFFLLIILKYNLSLFGIAQTLTKPILINFFFYISFNNF